MKSGRILMRTVACMLMAILPALAVLPPAGAAATPASGLPSTAASQAGKGMPLGDVLNPDGTLNLTSGFSGSLDPTGYTMQTGPNGEPRFVSAQTEDEGAAKDPTGGAPNIPGYFEWDARFNLPGTNGSVSAVAVNGSNVYVGGTFTRAGRLEAAHVAQWTGSQWNALGSGVNGNVHALAYVGGSLYAGGQFTQAGGVLAANVARWDGASWNAMGDTNGIVYAITANGTDLYVGGQFTQAGAVSVNNIARWDGASWNALGAGTDGMVRAIAASGTDIYVGGYFTTAGGQTVNRVARWDGAAWHDLNGGVSGTNSGVLAIALFGSYVYVGGNFSSAGGIADMTNIARYNPSTDQWYPMGTGVNKRVTSLVHSTAGYGLYVGGEFTLAGGITAYDVAMWSTSGGGGWSDLGIPAANGFGTEVFALGMAANGALYTGGMFGVAGGTVGNGGVAASNIARWYGSTWSALGTGSGVTDRVGRVYAVAAVQVGGSIYVYVGGEFNTVGEIAARNIARWDGSAWLSLGSGISNGTNGPVYALGLGAGTDVYVGGLFSKAGNMTANNVARWSNGIGWSTMDGGTDGVVKALAYSNYDLHVYVGGAFSEVGGSVPASNIARWNSSSGWSDLRQGTSRHLNGVYEAPEMQSPEVRSIAIRPSNGRVYVGGLFLKAGGENVRNLAAWGPNGTASFWNSFGSANAPVNALAFRDDNLYVGGEFTTIDPGATANRIARFSFASADWYSLGSGRANGVGGPVHALAPTSSGVYVGGTFDTAGGLEAKKVAGWNGSSWYALEEGLEVAGSAACSSPNARGLATLGSSLYVGGCFSMAGGKAAQSFSRRYWVSLP